MIKKMCFVFFFNISLPSSLPIPYSIYRTVMSLTICLLVLSYHIQFTWFSKSPSLLQRIFFLHVLSLLLCTLSLFCLCFSLLELMFNYIFSLFPHLFWKTVVRLSIWEAVPSAKRYLSNIWVLKSENWGWHLLWSFYPQTNWKHYKPQWCYWLSFNC